MRSNEQYINNITSNILLLRIKHSGDVNVLDILNETSKDIRFIYKDYTNEMLKVSNAIWNGLLLNTKVHS